MPRKILILSCGAVHVRYGLESFAQMFANSSGLPDDQLEILDATRRHPPSKLQDYAGVIVTGSQAMVTERQKWVERLLDWIPKALEAGLPMLGVCFGHQLMAMAMGGKVGYHPKSVAIGTFEIRLAPGAGDLSPILSDLPGSFPAHMYHAQVVLQAPPKVAVLGFCGHDPNCVISYGPNQLSVQFHPEFDLRIMKGFTKKLSSEKTVPASGARPEQKLLLNPLANAKEAGSLVAAFCAECLALSEKNDSALSKSDLAFHKRSLETLLSTRSPIVKAHPKKCPPNPLAATS